MYDELVKRLNVFRLKEGEYQIIPVYVSEIIGESADAIGELIAKLNHADDQIERLVEAADERRWIPVTERFPKFGVRVLCKCRANIYEVLTWTADGWEHDPQHVYMSGFVTHWMPLPEPPKEET